MKTPTIQELERQLAEAKAQATAEATKRDEELKTKFSGLHTKNGFNSPREFSSAYTRLMGLNANRRKGTRVTPGIKEKIRATFSNPENALGNKEVAAQLGISVPTLSLVKRALGLTRKPATA
jgi:hypothetical protein